MSNSAKFVSCDGNDGRGSWLNVVRRVREVQVLVLFQCLALHVILDDRRA